MCIQDTQKRIADLSLVKLCATGHRRGKSEASKVLGAAGAAGASMAKSWAPNLDHVNVAALETVKFRSHGFEILLVLPCNLFRLLDVFLQTCLPLQEMGVES